MFKSVWARIVLLGVIIMAILAPFAGFAPLMLLILVFSVISLGISIIAPLFKSSDQLEETKKS